MNDATVDIVDDAVQLAAEMIKKDPSMALAVVGATAYVGDYWDEANDFEAEAAASIGTPQRLVFALPLIVQQAEDGLSYRRLNDELGEGDSKQLWLLAFDPADGLDVLRCLVTDEGFTPVEILEAPVQLNARTPGFRLVQALLEQAET